MFGPDALNSQYVEDRQLAYKKRLAKEQAKQTTQSAPVSSCSTPADSRSPTPPKQTVQSQNQKSQGPSAQSLNKALLRTQSGGVLGGIFRDLSKTKPPGTPPRSAEPTPMREKSQMEVEAKMIAQRKRDADIVSLFYAPYIPVQQIY